MQYPFLMKRPSNGEPRSFRVIGVSFSKVLANHVNNISFYNYLFLCFYFAEKRVIDYRILHFFQTIFVSLFTETLSLHVTTICEGRGSPMD